MKFYQTFIDIHMLLFSTHSLDEAQGQYIYIYIYTHTRTQNTTFGTAPPLTPVFPEVWRGRDYG